MFILEFIKICQNSKYACSLPGPGDYYGCLRVVFLFVSVFQLVLPPLVLYTVYYFSSSGPMYRSTCGVEWNKSI